jgi:hypothetical protein
VLSSAQLRRPYRNKREPRSEWRNTGRKNKRTWMAAGRHEAKSEQTTQAGNESSQRANKRRDGLLFPTAAAVAGLSGGPFVVVVCCRVCVLVGLEILHKLNCLWPPTGRQYSPAAERVRGCGLPRAASCGWPTGKVIGQIGSERN